MKGGSIGKATLVASSAGLVLGAVATAGVAGASGAAPKVVPVGNGITITVPAGWTAGQGPSGDIDIAHKSPQAVIEVKSGTGVAGPVAQESTASFNQYIQSFGLKGTKVSGTQTTPISGSPLFSQVSSLSFTGKLGSQKLGGLWVFYENPNTGLACFAVAIAKTSAKAKLKAPVLHMFESLAG